MNNFPTELLHNIFIQLDLHERLVCALVCRGWWSVLDKYSLLYSIDIEGNEQFIRFMNMIAHSPHRATQVEELKLEGEFEKDFDKRTLCNTFPNVRYIRLNYELNNHRLTKPIKVTHTTSKIQHIYDNDYCEYTLQMMNSNLCNRLETLELDFGSTGTLFDTVIRELINMPVLKTLALHRPELSVADMEILHDNVPSIQTLHLNNIDLLDSEIPANITPATSLTHVKFEIKEVGRVETQAQWYLYLSKKYISVKEWSYNDKDQGDIDYDANYFYENGFLQFLKLVSSTQSALRIYNVPYDIDVFQVLDNVGARTKNVELRSSENDAILPNLAASNQSTYVKELTLKHAPISSFHDLQHLTSLTTLSLESVYDSSEYDLFSLADCLNSLPDSVKELSLYDDDYEVNSVNCKLNSIQYLTLACRTLTKDISDIISICFPNLVKVVLPARVKSDVNLVLPSQFLKSATFKLPILKKQRNFAFSFRCPGQVEPVFYTFEKKEKCMAYEEVKEKPILSVVSHTKKTLKFIYREPSIPDIVITS